MKNLNIYTHEELGQILAIAADLSNEWSGEEYIKALLENDQDRIARCEAEQERAAKLTKAAKRELSRRFQRGDYGREAR